MSRGSRALRQADALFDLGRYEQAATLAAQHLAGAPDDAPALVLLARCGTASATTGRRSPPSKTPCASHPGR